MTITTSTLVADIATASPATIKVFQRHRIDFCCGGRIPLGEICEAHQIEPPVLIGELEQALRATESETDWTKEPLTSLVAHIQARFHRPLEEEIPRLRAMVDKVVSRHGARLPRLAQLQETFAGLQHELLDHMKKEDVVLFPAIVALEAGACLSGRRSGAHRGADRRPRSARGCVSDVPWPVSRAVGARARHARARPPREPHPVPAGGGAGALDCAAGHALRG